MKECIYNIDGICEIFSDKTVKQPCIEGPCKDFKEKPILSELEKEKICACIQFQINRLNRKIDKLNEIDRIPTDKEYEELVSTIKTTVFYEKLINKIRSI